MDTNKQPGMELDIQIEELEDRIAPDGGETVLPLSPVRHRPNFRPHGNH